MALGSLFLVFVGMSLLAILGVVLLFWIKDEKANDIVLVLLTAFSLVIAYLGASAEPTNFVMQQIIHWLIGFVAVVGTGSRFVTKRQSLISKVLVSASVVAGIFYLFFL